MSAATEFYKGLWKLHGTAKGAGRKLRELKREEAESRNAQTYAERTAAYRRMVWQTK